METTPALSQKALKNSVWNLVAFLWPIVFSIFVTPIIVHRLHVESYGVLILINTILSTLALLELGMNASLIKSISEDAGRDNIGNINDRVGTMLLLNILLGIFGFLIMAGLGLIGLTWFKIPPTQTKEAQMVFLIGALIFLGNSISNTFSVIPQALQRYDLTAKISIASTALVNIATLIVILLGYHLVAVMIIQLLQVVVVLVIYQVYAKRSLPGLRIRLHFSRRAFAGAAHFGSFVFIKNISTQALTYFDRIVVSAFLGPSVVSFYSLPGSVTVKSVGVISSITGIFFPLTSQLAASGDKDKVVAIYRRVIRNILLLSAAGTCAVMMFGYKILFYWLGPEFATKSTEILYFLAVTYFFLSWYSPVANFLLGLGAVKFLAVSSLSMFLLDMLFLVLLLPHFHLIGAAWAYLLAVLPVPFLIVFAERRYLQLTNNLGFYARLIFQLLVVTAVYYAVSRWLLKPLVVNLFALIVIGPLSILAYLGLYKLFGFMPTEDWHVFKQFLNNLKGRFWSYGH